MNDGGKTVDVKVTVEGREEVTYGASYVAWFADEATRIYGDIIPQQQRGKRMTAMKEPISIVAAITPFNAPSNLLVQKLAPALITGNAVIIKPCLEGTRIAQIIAEAFAAGGTPEGLVQVVSGDRAEAIGLAAHPDVDG